MPRLCVPVPPTSSQTWLESTIPMCCEQFSPEMPLPNLYTSKVPDITTAHKTHRFQGDYCPIWELQPFPTTSIHTTWQGTGGSSFLRPAAGLVPNFWWNVKQACAVQNHSHLLALADLPAPWQPLCFLLPRSADGVSFWPPKTHPLTVRSRGGLVELPPVTALFSVLSYVMSNSTRQTFLWVLLLEFTWCSRRCILRWTFYRYGLYLWEGRSRSTSHTQRYNMLQSSWLLDHSSPLKRQINP